MTMFSLRINQSLEDDFEAYKARFNVSAVCHKAIEQEIQSLKAMDKAIGDRDKLIARWQQEWKMSRDKNYQEGLEKGKADAVNLEYPEVALIGSLVDEGHNGEYVVDHFEELGWSTFEEWDDWFSDLPAKSRSTALDGWVNGIWEIWQEMKDEVEVG